METLNFFRFLFRHKHLLIIIPIVTIVTTFFLTRNQSDSFQSHSKIATGIVDRPDAILNNNTPDSKINQEFSNIINGILRKRPITQVSYLLLEHDLVKATSFRKKSQEILLIKDPLKEKIIGVIAHKHGENQELDLTNKTDKYIQELTESMQYDEASLRKNLIVYRLNNSDLIDLQFESENPQLSAFVLNNLCKEFIDDFTTYRNENKNKTIAYLDSMMRVKQDTLHKKMQILQNYKIKNGVLDINDQASTLIGQIAAFEAKRQETQKNISAYQGAITSINTRFDPNDRRYIESSLTELNQEILSTRSRLTNINEDYIKSNFDPKIKAKADSLQSYLTEKINQANDKSIYNPVASKRSLVQEKLSMEISLELAKNTVSSLSNELNRLNNKLYTLVPNQATIKTIQDDIDTYSKEYTDLSNKYNQAVLDANFTTKLKQVEVAMPGEKLPSKKIIIIFLSGIVSFIFCIAVLFIIFFFDTSINNSKELANGTSLPVLGHLNLIKRELFDLQNLWIKGYNNQKDYDLETFRSLTRSIRFEIDQQLQNQNIVTITSLDGKSGKTFIALNLAYAYKMANKRVAIIDGNFDHPELTKNTNSKEHLFIEDYLTDEYEPITFTNSEVIILGNRGVDISLSELAHHSTISNKLQLLKNSFDIIIIEAPSLISYNKAKEWIGYSDKIIPVFKVGETIKDSMIVELDYLKTQREKVVGWILNKVK